VSDSPKGSAPAPVIPELFSAITPGDFGLKAGYWTGEDSDPMTFRPVLGWVTVTSLPPYTEANPPKNLFWPLVLSDRMYPVLAIAVPNCRGVFLKDMPEDQAKVRSQEWAVRPEPDLQPMMGMAQA